MDQTEVVLTYETLYELLRREKSREDLQKLDDHYFRDALNYLREKQQASDENLSKNDIFSQSERDKLQIQLNNIRKLVKDLYNIRERKLINMAINHTRTGAHIVDTEHLLAQERPIYDSLVAVLKQYRSGVLNRLLEQREPDFVPISEAVAAPVETPEPTTSRIKFLENIDQFVGEELEPYGPFENEEEATLPKELADVLISQGKAEEL